MHVHIVPVGQAQASAPRTAMLAQVLAAEQVQDAVWEVPQAGSLEAALDTALGQLAPGLN